jgi:hypothetical protein
MIKNPGHQVINRFLSDVPFTNSTAYRAFDISITFDNYTLDKSELEIMKLVFDKNQAQNSPAFFAYKLCPVSAGRLNISRAIYDYFFTYKLILDRLINHFFFQVSVLALAQ